MNYCVSMCVGKRGEVGTGNYLYHLGIKWDLVPQRSGRCWVGSLEFLFLGLRNSHLDLLSYSDFALCFMVQWRGFQWSDYGWPDPKLVRNEICLQASLPELNLAFAERSMSVRELRTGRREERGANPPAACEEKKMAEVYLVSTSCKAQGMYWKPICLLSLEFCSPEEKQNSSLK